MVTNRKFTLLALSLLLFFLHSCSSFDKEFYERITGIKFPKNYEVIESYDNGEFYTTTSFKVDSLILKEFISEYKFKELEKIYPSQFLGEHGLKKVLPDFSHLENKYYTAGTKGKNSWLYIVDLHKQILWAEVQYPDMAGD